ncbi:MAG: twin-arginine translocase subunit TatC [Proteobacteria bacterium]|nr:twin-arginine translocase subunit TatC [Pseudomonadota bacterium]MBU1688384.1 twin-arginine translocase subunit TatC [Pseudomonadota bacterium]
MAGDNPLAEFFGEHLKELRNRVLIVFVAIALLSAVAYIFIESIAFFFMAPIFRAAPDLSHLVYTHLTEAFISYLKLAVLTGLAGSFPVLCYEVWMFISPGLVRREKQIAALVTLLASALFVAGGAFAYFVALPRILAFLMAFSGPQLEPLPRLDLYLTFVARTILAFGLAFEIPFLMVASQRTGLVHGRYFREKRWLSYAAMLMLAFLLTAGEVVGALLLAVPLVLLFETGVLLSRLVGAKS